MPTITYVHENVKIDVPEGDSVRYPALENDIPVYCGITKFANCHGNGLCGTDRVAPGCRLSLSQYQPSHIYGEILVARRSEEKSSDAPRLPGENFW